MSELNISSGGVNHPVLDLIDQRVAEGSRPGQRSDNRILAIAIEGGGMSAAFSAGMCAAYEQLGLLDLTVDRIYGSSAGSLNGSYTAMGQAAIGAQNYVDTANFNFFNPGRLLLGRSVINFDFLFNKIIAKKRPYDLIKLNSGVEFKAIGVDLDTKSLELMSGFESEDEVMQAVRASCAIPLVGGREAVDFRGKHIADGGLLQSMPYQAAFDDGATDVLVFRSKPASYRKTGYHRAVVETAKRYSLHPSVPDLLEHRPERYNSDAEYLQVATRSDSKLLQIAPPEDCSRVSQLEVSTKKVEQALAVGAESVKAVLSGRICAEIA